MLENTRYLELPAFFYHRVRGKLTGCFRRPRTRIDGRTKRKPSTYGYNVTKPQREKDSRYGHLDSVGSTSCIESD